MKNEVKNIKEIAKEKEQRLMDTIAWRASYYRANPCRLVEEVWGIHLKTFQKMILHNMVHNNFTMYLAARG